MLNEINPEKLPDWTVLAFAGFLVATVTCGIFLMTPAPVAETPSCARQEAVVYLPDIIVPDAPKSALERPSEDWLWMAPEEASVTPVADDEPDEPRRHRRRHWWRRG